MMGQWKMAWKCCKKENCQHRISYPGKYPLSMRVKNTFSGENEIIHHQQMYNRGNTKGISSGGKWSQMEALSWRLTESINEIVNLIEHWLYKIIMPW